MPMRSHETRKVFAENNLDWRKLKILIKSKHASAWDAPQMTCVVNFNFLSFVVRQKYLPFICRFPKPRKTDFIEIFKQPRPFSPLFPYTTTRWRISTQLKLYKYNVYVARRPYVCGKAFKSAVSFEVLILKTWVKIRGWQNIRSLIGRKGQIKHPFG